MPDKTYVLNELLTYVSFYVHQFGPDKLQAAILRYFVPAEIDKAKDVLWGVLGEAVAGKKLQRKDSVNRAATEANIKDIITTLKAHKSDEVIFVANNLDRMPRWAPEELSIISLADRVRTIEGDLETVKQSLQTYNTNNNIIQPSTQETAASVAYNSVPSHPTQGKLSVVPRSNGPMLYSATTAAIPQVVPHQVPAINTARTNPRIRRNGSQSTRGPLATKSSRPKPVVGKNKASTVRGECRKVDLFIYRVLPDTDDASIEQLFKDADIKLFNFERVSHMNARMKSFKVTVSLPDMDRVCNDEFLPEDVMCRRFYRPKISDGDPRGRVSEDYCQNQRQEETRGANNAVSPSRSIVLGGDMNATNSDDGGDT